MVRFLVLATLVALSTAQAELQLAPSVVEYELEGVKLKELAFADGGKTATYQPPHGWDYFGSENQLTLHPPAKPQAEASISKVALTGPVSFDEASLQALTSAALALAPKESSAVTVIAQQKDPVRVSGKETFEVIFSYKLLGQTFNRSVIFLNREREQMRFQLVAREADFKELQRAFQSSLCTWQNL